MNFSQHLMDLLFSFDTWVVIGFIGQFMFTMRFLVQWWASEKAQKSVIPSSFWVFSILGGGIVLAYAIHKQDPVFIVGQAAGLLIYARNLYFVIRETKKTSPPA
jgi:lipid-A-disaccharide synthase-like uncharacterized protein